MGLFQLIYVSSATRFPSDDELHEILQSSLRHNTPNEVTGMLLYSNGSFIQALEGTEESVTETMSRIRADVRHHSIRELIKGPIRAREFPNWSMGFKALTATDAETWPGYAPFFAYGFNPQALDDAPSVALEILKSFAERNSN